MVFADLLWGVDRRTERMDLEVVRQEILTIEPVVFAHLGDHMTLKSRGTLA